MQDSSCSESDSDDEFFKEYKRKKLEKHRQETTLTKDHLDKDPTKFGWVRPINKAEYVREVNEAGEGVDVILHLYKDCVDKCVLINRVMQKLAKQHVEIKFLKTISDKCVPDFPDSQLPYILYYRDGKRRRGIQKIEMKALLPKVTVKSMKNLLKIIGVKGMEGHKFDSEEEDGVKDTVRNQLGWKRRHKKSEFDSGSDEDREFVSNKIKFK